MERQTILKMSAQEFLDTISPEKELSGIDARFVIAMKQMYTLGYNDAINAITKAVNMV